MKMIKEHRKTFVFIISIFFISLLFYFYYLINLKFLPYSSDPANTFLEAWDMLKGNIFLKGWHLPQDNFLFEDNIFYLIALRIFGFKQYIFAIVPALIYSLTVFTSSYFIFYKLKQKRNFNMLGLLLGFIIISLPQSSLFLTIVSQSPIHIVTILYLLLIVIFIDKYLNPGLSTLNKNKDIAFITGIVILESASFISDPLSLYLSIVPIILWSALSYMKSYKNKDSNQNNKRFLFIIIASMLSIVIEIIFIHFWSKYAVLVKPNISFATYDQLLNNIKLLVEGLFSILGANFFGLTLRKIITFFTLIRLAIFISIFYFVISTFKEFVRTKKYNINHLLSIMSIFTVLAYLFSNQPVGLLTSRYLTPFMIFGTIIFGTELNVDKLSSKLPMSKPILISISFLLIVIYISTTFSIVKDIKPNKTYYQLASYLEKNNLQYGYGSYWDSSIITVATENKIKIRSVAWDGFQISPYNWLSKKDWYTDLNELSKPFFILFDDSNHLGVNLDNCVKSFGNPSEVLKFQKFTILKYDNIDEVRYFKLGVFSKLYNSAESYLKQNKNSSNLYPQYLEENGYLDKYFGHGQDSNFNWTDNGGWIGKWPCPDGKGECFGIGLVGDINTLKPIIEKYKPQSLQIFFPYPKVYDERSKNLTGQIVMIFKDPK